MKPIAISKRVRNFLAITTLIVFSTGLVMAETDVHQSFGLLKGMEGKWVGKSSKGEQMEVTFHMTAGGSAP
jgi:hypothetical protein